MLKGKKFDAFTLEIKSRCRDKESEESKEFLHIINY